jgi:hypothetical protein
VIARHHPGRRVAPAAKRHPRPHDGADARDAGNRGEPTTASRRSRADRPGPKSDRRDDKADRADHKADRPHKQHGKSKGKKKGKKG